MGVRDGTRLVAMAGERMRLPGYVELSAIAAHPEARCRGHPENKSAVSVYRRLDFEVHREIWVRWRKPAARMTAS